MLSLTYLLDRARWSSPNQSPIVNGIEATTESNYINFLFNWTIHPGVIQQYTSTWYLWSIIFEHFEAWRTGNLTRIHKSSLRRTTPIYWTHSSVLLYWLAIMQNHHPGLLKTLPSGIVIIYADRIIQFHYNALPHVNRKYHTLDQDIYMYLFFFWWRGVLSYLLLLVCNVLLVKISD